jgi:poly(3-hydroxybutyrate) depolymerase
MHGGGGKYYQFCADDGPFSLPQIAFSESAVTQGFGVLLLDSTEGAANGPVTDNQGRSCGKVWDDEVRARPNVDLPFIGKVIDELIPSKRPAGSKSSVFITGLSSGGYMTVRAATHFDDRVTAFAPVSNGDPYGWYRLCDPALGNRDEVAGAGFDRETNLQIIQRNACLAPSYPNEKIWDTTNPTRKPTFRLFHHENDGINDLSCNDKLQAQLLAHGYPDAGRLLLTGGTRNLANHLWQTAYNQPLLDFFAAQ